MFHIEMQLFWKIKRKRLKYLIFKRFFFHLIVVALRPRNKNKIKLRWYKWTFIYQEHTKITHNWSESIENKSENFSIKINNNRIKIQTMRFKLAHWWNRYVLFYSSRFPLSHTLSLSVFLSHVIFFTLHYWIFVFIFDKFYNSEDSN